MNDRLEVQGRLEMGKTQTHKLPPESTVKVDLQHFRADSVLSVGGVGVDVEFLRGALLNVCVRTWG